MKTPAPHTASIRGGISAQAAAWSACAVCAAFALLVALLAHISPTAQFGASYAYAEETAATAAAADEGPKVLKGDTEIEQLTNTYKEFEAEKQTVEARINDLQAQIDELEVLIPLQQARCDRAMVLLYKSQKEPLAILDVMFKAQTLDDFLKQSKYIHRVSQTNMDTIVETRKMKEKLDGARAEQEGLKAEIEQRAESTTSALRAEQDKRAARQAQGISSSVGQAGSIGGEASVGVAADGGKQPEDYREAATPDTGALNDGADWHADRDEFIKHWAERLDRYLAGSALEGQGANFASAAWKYNIDPRWSAAISNTESSKGNICIRPHNAWGWGAADSDPYNLASEWGSWEEAIDAHAKGLSEGYGYTISMMGARSYCPNTWQSWYNKTLGQMAQI